MSIERQAEELARWLEANPGTQPPDGLDPEVVEAVYALRPDLAPAPKINLEAILDSVQGGPLAVEDAVTEERTVHMAEVIQLAHRRSPDQRVAPAIAARAGISSNANPNDEPKTPISPRFLLGTIGGISLLAAAMALFILVPALKGGFLIQQGPEQLALVTSSEQEAAEPTDEGLASRLAAEPDAKAVQAPAKPALNETRSGGASPSADLKNGAPPQFAKTIPEAEPELIGVVSQPDMSGNVSSLFDAPSTKDDISMNVSEKMEGMRTTAAMDENDVPVGRKSKTMKRSKPETKRIFTVEPPIVPKSTASQNSASVDSEHKVLDKKVSTENDMDRSSALNSWQQAAAPYPGDWHAPTLNAGEQQTYQQAQDSLKSDNITAAAQTLERAIPLSKSAIGQYFAAEASTYYLRANNTEAAIRVANRCVGLSAQNTAHLSRCYCALGDAYQAKGDPQKTKSAYEKAARLNGKR